MSSITQKIGMCQRALLSKAIVQVNSEIQITTSVKDIWGTYLSLFESWISSFHKSLGEPIG